MKNQKLAWMIFFFEGGINQKLDKCIFDCVYNIDRYFVRKKYMNIVL